jgi:serine protease Do
MFAAAFFGLSLGWVAAPPGATAQTSISHFMQAINPLLSHAQGYLGVLVTDVDNESVNKLKLKDAKGALITLIDHDAPAGQKGLRVNDVVLSVNGQAIDGAEQFGRILHDLPAGRKVTMVVTRDGAPQTFTVQLVDRKIMEHDVWKQMNDADAFTPAPAGMGIFDNGSQGWNPGHVSPFGSGLKVGAMVEPLDAQMAEYLNMQNGVMIKQVARKSEAANAGLKQFDVILKVGTDSIQTTADWDRALHANAGKQVAVIILRDRKQLVLNLQVDSKHHSQVIWTDMNVQGECPEMAWLDQTGQFGTDLAQAFGQLGRDSQPFFDQKQMDEFLRESEKLDDSFKGWAFPEFKIDPKDMESFGQTFSSDQFKFDPKQMDEFRKDMEQFRQSFDSGQFKIDPKQMEELQRQMEEFRKSFPQNFKKDRHQQDEFRRQLNQLRDLTSDQAV